MGMISARICVVGRVEADGQLGAQVGRLLGEALDAGNDAGGGDGHALRAQADFADQQAHGGHEVVVVEKRLAHAHEDQVHAVAAHVDAVAVEDRDDLAGDLAGGEVALQAEFGGEAELAVDGAADLAGDADGGAAPGSSFRMAGSIRRVLVAGLAVVAFGHPDGFHGFWLSAEPGQLDQVALGSVGGLEDLGNRGTADLPALGGQFLAQSHWQSGDFEKAL